MDYLVLSCLRKRANVQLLCTQGKLLVIFSQKENNPVGTLRLMYLWSELWET